MNVNEYKGFSLPYFKKNNIVFIIDSTLRNYINLIIEYYNIYTYILMKFKKSSLCNIIYLPNIEKLTYFYNYENILNILNICIERNKPFYFCFDYNLHVMLGLITLTEEIKTLLDNREEDMKNKYTIIIFDENMDKLQETLISFFKHYGIELNNPNFKTIEFFIKKEDIIDHADDINKKNITFTFQSKILKYYDDNYNYYNPIVELYFPNTSDENKDTITEKLSYQYLRNYMYNNHKNLFIKLENEIKKLNELEKKIYVIMNLIIHQNLILIQLLIYLIK